MTRFLSNLSVKASLTAILVLFTLLILGVAGLGYVANQQGQRIMANIDRLNADLIRAVNQTRLSIADAQLDLQQVIDETTRSHDADAQAALADARAMLARADERFAFYLATPKHTAQGRQFEAVLQPAYDALKQGLTRQIDALAARDFAAYRDLQPQVFTARETFRQASLELMTYADSRSDALMADYAAQTDVAEIIQLGVIVLAGIIVLLIRLALVRTVAAPLQDAVQHFSRMAEGDLSQAVADRGRNEIGQLFTAMRDMQDKLAHTVATVRHSSESIHVGAREIASGNTDLSSRTEQQAASLEETASSMEELTSTVRQNADNARQGSTLAQEASATAGRGGEVVDEVIETMHGIAASSQKVTEIIGVIDSIAFQTNILALNASVEAARAGEQGRGFAVVASEVRSLASRSAEAAKEIKALIEASAAQIAHGSTLVEGAGTTMQDIVASVRRVTDIVDEITAASQEQSSGIEQVNQAVAQMDQVTQQNASLVQEAAAASASLEAQAAQLAAAVAIFRLAEGQGATAAMPAAPASAPPRLPARSAARPAASTQAVQPVASVGEWEDF